MDETTRLARLEQENETLRALLLLNNIKVVFGEEQETLTYKGDVGLLKQLASLKDELNQLRTQYLLARADAVVLKEQFELFMGEMTKRLKVLSSG